MARKKKIINDMRDRRMLPSEFAREQGKDFHNFLWWDTNRGKVNFTEYKEIEKEIYGGR